MDTRKILVKVSYGLVAALIVVLVALPVYQEHRIRQMSQNGAQAPLSSSIDSSTPALQVAEGGREQLEEEVDALRYQLEASEEELDMALNDLAHRQGFDIREAMAMEEKVKENPTLMNMRRRESENFLNQTHGALFGRLGLPDEKLQDLKTLLVDFQMQENEGYMSLDNELLPEEEKLEIQQQLENQRSEFEKQAKDLLGPENYEIYETYEDSLSERFFVHAPFNPLSEDLGVSDEKAQELIDAMYAARKKVEAGYDTDALDQTLGSASLNPAESKNRMLERYDAYIESAKGILSESQAEQFEIRANEMKERIKMNLVGEIQ
jgi:hypothetical protein